MTSTRIRTWNVAEDDVLVLPTYWISIYTCVSFLLIYVFYESLVGFLSCSIRIYFVAMLQGLEKVLVVVVETEGFLERLYLTLVEREVSGKQDGRKESEE